MDVGSQVIGRKDMTSSVFDIWGEVSKELLFGLSFHFSAVATVPVSYFGCLADFSQTESASRNGHAGHG